MSVDTTQSTPDLTGYGPSTLGPRHRFKIFNGDAQTYSNWEDSFMAGMRFTKLHYAFPKYANARPASFNLTESKQYIYDYLTGCIDSMSHGIIRREAPDDGVKALDVLRAHYLRQTGQRIFRLMNDIVGVKMGDRDAVSYLTYIEEIAESLHLAGETISDRMKVLYTLNGLSQRYKSFVEHAYLRDIPYTYNELKVALLSTEDRQAPSAKGADSTDQIMAATDKKKWTPTCHRCGEKGHYANQCNKAAGEGKKSNKTQKPKRWCEYHNAKSHNTADCRVLNDKKNDNSVKTANDASEDDTTITFHIAHTLVQDPPSSVNADTVFSPGYDSLKKPQETDYQTEMILNVEAKEDLILVDSGCTAHIEKNQQRFGTFEKSFDPRHHFIELADGQKQDGLVQGMGAVTNTIKDQDGTPQNIVLKDALYIPNFKHGILSVWKTIQHGHSITFAPNGSTLTTKDGKTFDIVEKNKLFYLRRGKPATDTQTDKFNKVHTGEGTHTLEEWHKILGHCNVNDVQRLEAAVDGMKISNKDKFNCPTCILGKMTQSRNREPDQKATQRLELVHCDLAGPIDPISLGGFKYCMSYVDDYSGVIKIYLLKQKSDAVLAMKSFLAETAQYGSIKRLRCDQGTEFTSNVFKSLLIENKIKQEFSAPYSPHQNGTVERSHRSIFDMARCLLIDAHLPKSLWNYAVKAASYIRNRCYNPRTGKTPVELMTGKRPNISKMHVFGTKCFAYEQDKKKLDPRSKQGVFVGYDDQSPAYLI